MFGTGYMARQAAAGMEQAAKRGAGKNLLGMVPGFLSGGMVPGIAAGAMGLLGLNQPDQIGMFKQGYKQLEGIFGPQAFLNKSNQMFAGMKASPMYSGALAGLLGQGNLQAQQLKSGLARTGMNSSALGRVSKTLAGSNTASQLGNLNLGLYGMGMGNVMQLMGMQSQAAMGAQEGSMRRPLLGALFQAAAGSVFDRGNKKESK